MFYSINEKVWSNASCASRFKQFILTTPCVSVSTQYKEIIEIYILLNQIQFWNSTTDPNAGDAVLGCRVLT